MNDMQKSLTDSVRWLNLNDRKALCAEASRRICVAASQAISQRGQFKIVLTGGSTSRGVYKLLCNADSDWSRWQIFFSDERCLSADNYGRNSRMANEAWLRHVPIPPHQIHVIPAERGADQAATAYTKTLSNVGQFDLVLLGLCEGGHTTSLLPASEITLIEKSVDVVAVSDAPRQVVRSVSLSAARLSRARTVLLLAAGAAKRHAVSQWQASATLQAARIRPAAGVDVLMSPAL